MRVAARRVLVDAVVALLLGWACFWASVVNWAPPELDGPRFDGKPHLQPNPADVEPWALAAIVFFMVGITLRAVWPRIGFVLITVGVGGYLAAGTIFGPVFLAPALGIYAMAMALPMHQWLPLTPLLAPMIIAGFWREPYLGLLDPRLYATLVLGVAVAVVPALIALLRRSRRESERVTREQDRRRYAYEERMRIARDVHDVVGHSLSVISMQAGVALHVLDRRPDQVAESLEAIRSTSREALAELRMTLGMFRDQDPGEPRAPVPGMARLDDLVAALRKAGRTVELVREDRDDQRLLPVAVDQAAYRIIQEALTNVVRHAGEATATVRVRREAEVLLVEVEDDGSTTTVPEPGNGIRGMEERARSVGGRLDVSPRPGGGLRVRAVLPVGGEAR
jgi:signal transduction histidine kinase